MDWSSIISERSQIRLSFSLERRIDLYEDLGAFVSQGLGPKAAIARMLDVLKKRNRPKWKIKLLTRLSQHQGDSFAVSIARYVPPQEAALLIAGEKSNTLVEALEQTVELLRMQREIKGRLWAVFAPLLPMIVAVLAIYIGISTQIYEQFVDMIGAERLANLSVAGPYFALGQFLSENIIIIVLAGLACLGLLIWSLPNWRASPARQWLDQHIPPWSMFSRVQASFFMLSVVATMKSGRPFKQIIESTRPYSSQWLRSYLRMITRSLEQGESEIKAMQLPFVPDDVKDRLSIYAGTGGFIHVMEATAKHSNQILIKKVSQIGVGIGFGFKLVIIAFILLTLGSLIQAALDMATFIRSSSL